MTFFSQRTLLIFGLNNQDLNSEKELLLQVAYGDEQAFRRLSEQFSPVLYTTIFRLTRQQWMADEIVQDTLLNVWKNRAELPQIENFGGWLYTIASNLTINALRKANREKEEMERWLHVSSDEDSYGPSLAYQTQWHMLDEAVNRLPPKQRETYRLIKEERLSRKEVAIKMDVSPETVKWNLEQAIRSIRAYCVSRLGFLFAILMDLINF